MSASATRTAPRQQVCRLSSEFGEWSPCVTTPCTASGLQSRTKSLLQPPVGSLGPCSLSSWIETRSCTGNVTLPCPSCSNGVADVDESDVDCGGRSSCPRCEGGWYCTSDSDCAAGYECGTGQFCIGTNCCVMVLAFPFGKQHHAILCVYWCESLSAHSTGSIVVSLLCSWLCDAVWCCIRLLPWSGGVSLHYNSGCTCARCAVWMLTRRMSVCTCASLGV
jgi:hypothetical protein